MKKFKAYIEYVMNFYANYYRFYRSVQNTASGYNPEPVFAVYVDLVINNFSIR